MSDKGDPNERSGSDSGSGFGKLSRELQVFEPSPDAVYSIEATSLMSNVPRRRIVVFCKHNLVSPATGSSEYGYYFSGSAIRHIRRIDALRNICGDDFAGIRIILKLSAALERLRSEITLAKRKKEINATSVATVPRQRTSKKHRRTSYE